VVPDEWPQTRGAQYERFKPLRQSIGVTTKNIDDFPNAARAGDNCVAANAALQRAAVGSSSVPDSTSHVLRTACTTAPKHGREKLEFGPMPRLLACGTDWPRPKWEGGFKAAHA